MGFSVDELASALSEIVADHRTQRPPFQDTTDMVSRSIEEISSNRDRCQFLTLISALNYQRQADRLYRNGQQLWKNHRWVFDPETIHEDRAFDDLANLFDQQNLRYGTADARIWHENSYSLYTEFDGGALTLIADREFDAKQLDEYVRTATGDTLHYDHSYRFPYLRGEKIRPLWLRVIHDFVHPLENIDILEMPIDTHIIQLTNEIFGTSYTDTPGDKQEIQHLWRQACDLAQISPVDLDRPFWYIHTNWNEWGEEYLVQQLGGLPKDLEETNLVSKDKPA